MQVSDWNPNIIVFACNWCTYQGADLAGSLRYKYPTGINIIRVPCSGSLEAEYIVEALNRGADGVLVGGCHPGDCHYKEGNYKAARRFKLLHRLLEDMGVEPQRVKLEWISGSEGKRFAQVMNEFDAAIRKLGPNPIGRNVNA